MTGAEGRLRSREKDRFLKVTGEQVVCHLLTPSSAGPWGRIGVWHTLCLEVWYWFPEALKVVGLSLSGKTRHLRGGGGYW